jgi:2-succinyl-6-hydroxy-2,4-cyclohexadiene-1-carboxylate synthase
MTQPSRVPDRPRRNWTELSGPLHAEIASNDDSVSPPLIVLHGFTQTCRSWDPFLDALESVRGTLPTIVRVDLPGHGGSGDVSADLPTTADLVVETCGAGIYCGYSMGGRVALHVAVQHPHIVRALITIGATAGILDVNERARRRSADDDLAATIERIGTTAFIDQWLAQDMFAGLPKSDDDLAQRRSNSASGLAASVRLAGTGTQQSLWPQLKDFTMPILFLAGANDQKFSAIADDLARAVGPTARSERIRESGHSAHLENPMATAQAIDSFLNGLT